ncbi:MAG: V-type ATP synthase subunit I, partial [Candidatus Aenigmatarchaeota archaeon]
MIEIKPAEMTRVSVTGPKKYLQDVIDTLHQLELLHIDDYSGEFETGEPFEEAENLSEMLVDVRSLLSKLPQAEGEEEFEFNRVEQNIEDVREKVSELEDEREELEKQLSSVKDQQEFFRDLRGSGVSAGDLDGTDTLGVYVGDFDVEEFRVEVGTDSYEIAEGEGANVVFYYREESGEIERALSSIDASEISVVETEMSGTVSRVLEELEGEIDRINDRLSSIDEELESVAEEWRPQLEAAEEYLDKRVEKAEAPLRFGTTERTFMVEGYVPADDFDVMREEIIDITDGSIHIEQEEPEKPPVKHENNALVQPFESLTDLVAIPKYNELDPSFLIFLTFPIMFGFMIGDLGYGLASLAVFYAGYRKIPGARD